MKDIEFVILDIDGTILNNKRLYRWIVEKTINPNSILYQIYLNTWEGKTPKILRIFLQKISEITDGNKVKKIRGVTAFLKLLHKEGIRIFGSTRSDNRKTEKRLREQKVFKFFDVLKGREINKIEHIPYFANLMGRDLEDFSKHAIYIGDEPGDINIAKRFKIKPIIVTNTFSQNELVKFNIEKNLIVKRIREAIKK